MGKDKTFYQFVSPEDTREIVAKHVMGNEVVERLTWKVGDSATPVPVQTDLEFFKRQTKIVSEKLWQHRSLQHRGVYCLQRISGLGRGA